MSIKIKTAKKIGLFTAISVLIGSIIGIGIFFKNNSVFENNGNNPYGVLISWILASVISLLTAFSFAEVGFNHRDGAGLSGSCERLFNKKFGRFIAFNNSVFYFGVLNLSIAIFSAESLIKLFFPNESNLAVEIHVGYLMLISIVLMFIFIFFNYLSIKLSGHFQNVTTILKFVPLIAVGLAGIIYGAMNPGNDLFNPEPSINPIKTNPISLNGILSSIPAILFAYDSFLGVASLQGEMENPKKKVPLTIVLGMGICIAVYLFITVGQIMVSQGTAGGVFDLIFKDNIRLKNIFNILVHFFIFISAIGCLNSLTLVSLRTNEFAIRHRIVVGHWSLLKYSDEKNKAGMFLSLFISVFWWVILLIPSTILNTDGIIDGVSNFPTLFSFAIYGTVVFKAWINRFSKKVHVNKLPGFIVIAPLAVIGCYLAFGYQFFYRFSTKVLIDGIVNNDWNQTFNWGLFFGGDSKIGSLFAMIIFFTMLVLYITLPFINDLFIKIKYRKLNDDLFLKNELLI